MALLLACVAGSGCTVWPAEIDSGDAEMPIAVSTGGNATGSCVLPISYSGQVNNLCVVPGAAVATGNGSATGEGGYSRNALVVSNTGPASGGLITGSLGGDASWGLVSLAPLGDAIGHVAVSGTGAAHGNLAVSATGNAGGGIAISVTGDASNNNLLGIGGGGERVVTVLGRDPRGACAPESQTPPAPRASTSPDRDDGTWFQAHMQREKLSSILDFETLLPWIEAEFSSRYGGSWIDSSAAGDLLCVGLRNASANDLARIRSFATGPDNRIAAVSVKYSSAELNAFSETIKTIVRGHQNPAFTSVLGGVMTDANALVVQMDPPDTSLATKIAQRVPVDAVVFHVGPRVAPATRQTYPPYKGGRTIQNKTRPNICTSGLLFRATANNPAAGPDGHYLGSAAGHCGELGDRFNIWDRDVQIGAVTADATQHGREKTTADALVYSIDQTAATRAIYITEEDSRLITGSYNRSTLVKDEDVCISGWRSQGCGQVYLTNTWWRLDYKDTGDGKQHSHIVEGGVCFHKQTRKGDSGAPIFSYRENGSLLAAGVLSVYIYYQDGTGQTYDTGNSCFSPVWNIETELGVHLAKELP